MDFVLYCPNASGHRATFVRYLADEIARANGHFTILADEADRKHDEVSTHWDQLWPSVIWLNQLTLDIGIDWINRHRPTAVLVVPEADVELLGMLKAKILRRAPLMRGLVMRDPSVKQHGSSLHRSYVKQALKGAVVFTLSLWPRTVTLTILRNPLTTGSQKGLAFGRVKPVLDPVGRRQMAERKLREPLELVMVGALGPRKGIDDAIGAAESLPGGYGIVIAGKQHRDNSTLDTLAKLASVRMVNRYLSESEFDDAIAGALAVLVLNRDGLPSGVMTRAISFGVPVVATPGMCDLIEDKYRPLFFPFSGTFEQHQLTSIDRMRSAHASKDLAIGLCQDASPERFAATMLGLPLS